MFPNLGGFMHQVGKHGASFGCGRAPEWFANRPFTEVCSRRAGSSCCRAVGHRHRYRKQCHQRNVSAISFGLALGGMNHARTSGFSHMIRGRCQRGAGGKGTRLIFGALARPRYKAGSRRSQAGGALPCGGHP